MDNYYFIGVCWCVYVMKGDFYAFFYEGPLYQVFADK